MRYALITLTPGLDEEIELTRVNEELAQAQMLAEEANLGKTRFLAAAGHDILQPLNAARLYCSSLIEKAGKGAAGKAAVNIESSLESVETILGAVLDISRLDAGAMKPDDTTFSLDGLLRQIGNDFRPLAAEKKLDLTIMPSSLSVMTDRNLLRRLIQRDQIYAPWPCAGGRAAARRPGRDPGHRYRHWHCGRQAEHRVSRVHPAR